LQTVVNVLAGKANNTAPLTLSANVTSTAFVDSRIGALSAFTFTPTTAHAAAALSGLYVTSQSKGSATVNHSSTADVDKTFTVAIHGG
jgi:hypothetical protein